MATESEISKSVKLRLGIYQHTGVVEWFERIQSLKIRHQGYWIAGAAKGTPDYLALLRLQDKRLAAVFIEVKSSVGKLRPEQAQFVTKHHNGVDIFVLKISHPAQLDEFINRYGIDKTKELPHEI